MWMTHALCCRLKYDKFADSVLDCWRHYIGHFNRMQTVVNAFSARSCDEIAWRSCRIDTSDRQENMRTRARALTETRVGIGAHRHAHAHARAQHTVTRTHARECELPCSYIRYFTDWFWHACAYYLIVCYVIVNIRRRH